jgi:hypothetical protein
MMSVRDEVRDFAALGPLPTESNASVYAVEKHQAALEKITPPVTSEEAYLLMTTFGPEYGDSCFGLAWSVLHLVETCPDGVPLPRRRPPSGSNPWLLSMWDRSNRGGEQ